MIAICAIIKNEHKYLKEWIDYHLNIGFNHIYLFEDYDSISHADIVKDYANVTLHSLIEAGIGEYVPKKAQKYSRQEKLYKWALNHYKGIVDWLAFIDIDEYFEFEDGYDLYRLLDEFKDKSGIYLYWKMITASGQIEYKDEPLRERFSEVGNVLMADEGLCFKSFINLNVNEAAMRNIHECYDLYNTRGIRTPRIACFYKAWLNHYFTKSWEEWCVRFYKRGDFIWGHRKLDDFFELNKDMYKDKNHLMNMYYHWQAEHYKQENKNCVIKVYCIGGFANQLYEASYAIGTYGLNHTYVLHDADSKIVDILQMNGVNVMTEYTGEIDTIVSGFNQAWDYINWDAVRKIFKCPEPYRLAIEKRYPNINDMVVCHVRRGDYLFDQYNKRFRILTGDYIANVREKHFKNMPMLVVSNDIQWCKENIPNALFSDGDTLFDFYCICMAGGIIASASTYSICACGINNTVKCVIPYPLYNKTEKDTYLLEIEHKISPPYAIREKL